MLLSASNAEDFDAIDRYVRQRPAITPAAQTLQNEWIKWANGVTWLGKGLESNVREAENRRNAFNIANFRTAQEVNEFKDRIAGTGEWAGHPSISREEMQGKPRVVDSAGNYPKSPGVTVASAAKGTVLPGARPVIRQGSKGDAVKSWQAIIGVLADGNFGPATAAATKVWQAARGLVADGIVGSASWGAALGSQAPHMPLVTAQTTPVAPVGVKASQVKTGQVIPTGSISKPKATTGSTKPISQVVNKASSQPVTSTETLVQKFNKQSTVAKAGMIGGVGLILSWFL